MSADARVLVIGGGPAGMATTAELVARAVSVHHIDGRGVCGGAYNRIYPAAVMTTPARFLALPGLPLRPRAAYISVGEYRAYLERYARRHQLLPERRWVRRVVRAAGGYQVRLATPEGVVETREYQRVVVATGMFDHPVRPAIPGLVADGSVSAHRPVLLHAGAWRGVGSARGARVLIIGAASSGVEIAEAYAGAGAQVVVSTRSGQVSAWPQSLLGVDPARLFFPWTHRLPRRFTRDACERGYTAPGVDRGFGRWRRRGLIEVRGPVRRFRGLVGHFHAGPPVAFDTVILATGYRHHTPFLPAEVARTGAGHPRCRGCLSVSHPGLYVVGLPCAHKLTASYLYGIARDSTRVARAIAGASEL